MHALAGVYEHCTVYDDFIPAITKSSWRDYCYSNYPMHSRHHLLPISIISFVSIKQCMLIPQPKPLQWSLTHPSQPTTASRPNFEAALNA